MSKLAHKVGSGIGAFLGGAIKAIKPVAPIAVPNRNAGRVIPGAVSRPIALIGYTPQVSVRPGAVGQVKMRVGARACVSAITVAHGIGHLFRVTQVAALVGSKVTNLLANGQPVNASFMTSRNDDGPFRLDASAAAAVCRATQREESYILVNVVNIGGVTANFQAALYGDAAVKAEYYSSK